MLRCSRVNASSFIVSLRLGPPLRIRAIVRVRFASTWANVSSGVNLRVVEL